MTSCFFKDFMFSHCYSQSAGHHKISNGEIGQEKDPRILTESQKYPQMLTTDQCNGTTPTQSPIPPSAPPAHTETVNKKTKCTTKKPQAFQKFGSNIEVGVRKPNKMPPCILYLH